MRACATAYAVVLGLAASAFGFGACSSGQAPSPPTTPVTETATATTVAPLFAPPPTEASKPKITPHSVADCKQVLSDITNASVDGGVVMNNAMTAGDAGRSDRFQPVAELIKSKNDAYRCCFDLWARKHPEAAGKELPIKVQWNLKPDGTLESAEVDQAASQLNEPEVSACMVDISKGLTYPPSPSGKITKFTYIFQFKVRHAAP